VIQRHVAAHQLWEIKLFSQIFSQMHFFILLSSPSVPLSLYFSCVKCFGRVAPYETITHPPLLPWAWGEGIKSTCSRSLEVQQDVPRSQLVSSPNGLLSFFTLAFHRYDVTDAWSLLEFVLGQTNMSQAITVTLKDELNTEPYAHQR